MAAGSFNLNRTGNTSSYLSFLVNWDSISNGAIVNSSTLNIAIYAVKSSASTSNTWGTINTSVSVTDGGIQYENGLALNVAPGSSQLIFAKSFTVKHDDNGKKSVTIDVNVDGNVAWGNGSANITLDTIPRASSIAVANYDLGQNIAITIGRKNDSFTSTLTYKIGSRTGTILEKTSETNPIWEMSEELVSLIKQDNSTNREVNAIIYCETYGKDENGNDIKIGDTKDAVFKLFIVDKPKINEVTINETIELIKQYTTKLVKYLSVPEFKIIATSGEGTTISNYKVKVGDREFNSTNDVVTINNIQYSYLDDNGNRKTKFIVTITDERGNSSEEYPIKLDFIEYIQLSFNNTDITLTRLNGTSNYMKLKMTGYVYTGMFGENQNTLSIQYRYKLRNDNTAIWSELKEVDVTLNDDNTFEIDNLQLEDEFDYKENYDIELYASDLFSTIYYSTVIKTSETIVKVHKNGLDVKNLSINKKQVLYEGMQEQYSTEEKVVGTWINNKSIYRRVIETTTETQLDDREITIDNIDILIMIHGLIQVGEIYIPIPYANAGAPVYAFVNDGVLTLHISVDDFANKPAIIMIEYTKTTD